MESMDAIMLRATGAAVIDAAAGDDRNVSVIADVEIIDNRLRKASLCDDDRDVNNVVLRVRLDGNF